MIEVAAYTGSRIEELCSLQIDFINLNELTFRIVDAKTKAGNRIVPIHSKLQTTINRLISTSTNSYLFDRLNANKYGDRSNAIGKRFGHLKTSLGHAGQFVFHSIRKTFTTELERAGIAENIAADIVGHEKQTMTYGLYSGGASIEQKRDAVEKLNFNFTQSKTPAPKSQKSVTKKPAAKKPEPKKTTKTVDKKSDTNAKKSRVPAKKKMTKV